MLLDLCTVLQYLQSLILCRLAPTRWSTFCIAMQKQSENLLNSFEAPLKEFVRAVKSAKSVMTDRSTALGLLQQVCSSSSCRRYCMLCAISFVPLIVCGSSVNGMPRPPHLLQCTYEWHVTCLSQLPMYYTPVYALAFTIHPCNE